MLHVVLDTNIFRHDPARKKIAFRALSKLAKSGFIKIYIPYVVYKEFVSQEINNYLEDIGNLNKGMRGLLKRNLPEDIRNLIGIIDQKTGNIREDIEAFVNDNFLQWMADNNVELMQIKNHHGQNVIAAYFDGKHPFAKIKNREDFPDAFIWESICDLINEVDSLYVISNDGGIIKACEPQGKIITYNNLEDFIKSDICHERLRDIYFEEKLPEIISNLKTRIPAFKTQLDHILLRELPHTTFKDYNIPSEDNEATISSVGEVEELEIMFEESEYYGEGYLVIPFNCTIEVYADYYIFKGDYYSLPEEKVMSISISDHSDHYYEAEDTIELEIEGSLSIYFDISGIADSDEIIEKFDTIFENATIEVENMKITPLNIKQNY